MPKSIAEKEALALASSALAGVDLTERSRLLGLPMPQEGRMALRMFGRNVILNINDLTLTEDGSGAPVKIGDHILLLHYLAKDVPVSHMNDLVTFRDFPGGQFYYQPFRSRSVDILLKKFRNNVLQLRENLARFDSELLDSGDLTACIQAFGPLSVTLLYRLGDDEFPPSCDILFDACALRALCAEDASVVASRICIGLL